MLSDRPWQHLVVILMMDPTFVLCGGRSHDENGLLSHYDRSGPQLPSFKVCAIVGGVISALWALALGRVFFKEMAELPNRSELNCSENMVLQLCGGELSAERLLIHGMVSSSYQRTHYKRTF
jgi:hypothetical protein